MELVIFLEESSAEALLEQLLPRLLPENVTFRCIPFEGKQDMEKQLGKRLRAWRKPDCSFVVLRDKDSADCRLVKQKLVDICQQAGKPEALIRIACHELESWFLGDLQAVESAMNVQGLSAKQNNKKFRNPDRLANPKQELRKLTKEQYQPVRDSRGIACYLSLNQNRSTSFNVFLSGIRQLTGSGEAV
jgi:hypothetical protein